MDDCQSSERPPLFSLFDNPFFCLGIDPTATDQNVDEAFQQAESRQATPLEYLNYARTSLLEPIARLFAELSYPIDSTADEIASIDALLAGDTPIETLIEFGESLRPISRANFLAHVAALGPADNHTLCAILSAHASLDTELIYANVKAIRARACFLPPALLSINQTLDQLLTVHAQAIFGGYDKAEDAALALSICADRTRSSGDTSQKRALERVLRVYRLTFRSRLADGQADILDACNALSIQPTDHQLDKLLYSLRSWILTSLPLISNSGHQSPEWQSFEIIRQRLSAVLGNLTLDHHYEIALKLATFARDVLDPVFRNGIPFADDVHLIESRLLAQRCARASDDLKTVEAPPQPAAILLQSELQSFGSQRNGERGEAYDSRTTYMPERSSRSRWRMPMFALAAISLTLVLGATVYLARGGDLALDRLRVADSSARVAESPGAINDRETIPPVGTGQHLDLEGVRYCHYQEERLKLIQPDAREPDAVRSFNMLAVDYNARCSDYFYKGSDLAAVKAEIVANHQRLADDAKRIVSSWSSASAGASISTP